MAFIQVNTVFTYNISYSHSQILSYYVFSDSLSLSYTNAYIHVHSYFISHCQLVSCVYYVCLLPSSLSLSFTPLSPNLTSFISLLALLSCCVP